MLPQSPLVKLHFSSWNKIDHLPCVQNSQTNPNCTNPSFKLWKWNPHRLLISMFFFSKHHPIAPIAHYLRRGMVISCHLPRLENLQYSTGKSRATWPLTMAHAWCEISMYYVHIYMYIYIYYLYIYILFIYGWILIIPWPENRSSKATLGWFRLPTMIPMTSQWGRY